MERWVNYGIGGAIAGAALGLLSSSICFGECTGGINWWLVLIGFGIGAIIGGRK